MNETVRLTRREVEVTELLVWGAAKKEVADKLDISTHTVDNIARSIYEKVGIQKVGELAAWWFCTKYRTMREAVPKDSNLFPFRNGCALRKITRVVPDRSGRSGKRYRVESMEFSFIK